jgi:hypothetical protein
MLNETPRHEDTGGSGVIAPRLLNLGTICRRVVSFTSRPFYPDTYYVGGWVDPRLSLDEVVKRKNHFLCRESIPCCPASSLVIVLTEVPRLYYLSFKKDI